MNENIDSFVLRREYKKGNYYSYGDLVEYKGSSYLALADGNLEIPVSGAVWYRLNSRNKFYRTTVKPKFSQEGDKWFDPSSGVLYTRIKQSTGDVFWIEL